LRRFNGFRFYLRAVCVERFDIARAWTSGTGDPFPRRFDPAFFFGNVLRSLTDSGSIRPNRQFNTTERFAGAEFRCESDKFLIIDERVEANPGRLEPG